MSNIKIKQVISDHVRDSIDDDTIIDYLVEVVTDLTSTREEIEDTLKDYLNEYDNHKDKAKTDVVVDKLMEALGFEKAEKRVAVKKLDAPITIGNSLRTEAANPFEAVNSKFGNTYEVVIRGLKDGRDQVEKEACVSIEEFIDYTRNPDPVARKIALRDLCPCHVKRNVPAFWNRIIEMTTDPDPYVRYQVLHNLCDGSPKEREDDIIRALEGT
jgi:hypothetical protein